jgi:Myb-like DNA-binding domain
MAGLVQTWRQGDEMSGAARRGTNWTAEEDQRLLKLVEAGKSWVLISANLKRTAKSAQARLAYLGRHAIKAEFEREIVSR